ncbi:MAG: sialidase family protein [Bacteroidia bacterium]
MRHTFLIAVCIGLFLHSHGQGTLPKERSAEIVQKIIREKLRPGFLDNPEVRKHLPATLQAEFQQEARTANITEVVVSGGSEAESEVHATGSPQDSTILIVSSNTVDPNGSGATDVPVNHIYYSHDFGSTWQRSAFDPLPVTSGVTIAGGGDPNFCYDMNGRIYTSWINLYLQGFTSVTWDLLWAYSDDDGVTWQRGTDPAIISTTGPITALFDPTQFNGPIADKEWLAVDRGFSSYANTVYCVYYEAGGPANLNAIAVRHLSPGSGSFSSSTYVTDNSFVFVQFGSIDVAANGRVHVSFFGSTDNVNFGVYHAYSDDGGISFSAPQLVSETQIPNFSPGQSGQTIAGINVDRMYPCVYLAVDKSYMQTNSGNAYLVWSANGVNAQGTTGMDIYFSKSTDEGQTWSPAIVLNNTAPGDASDQFYPNLAVSYGGIVAVGWYDRRNHPGTANTDYYMAWSFDGGTSFNNDIPVSDAPTDFNTIGSVNQDFGIGEYNGLVVTENYGIPVWGDGRTNDGELDLMAALVPFRFNTGLPAHTGSIASLSLAPNPAGSFSRVEVNLLTAGTYRLQIVDARGRICTTSTLQLPAGVSRIPIESHQLANGHYTILLRNDKGLSQSELIVNH